MKSVILGDIHGNADALKAVLKDIPADTSELWILGDITGYYYRTLDVLELLKNYSSKVIMGNHELILKEGLTKPEILVEYKNKYGSSLDLLLKNADSKAIQYLTSLPESMNFILGNKKIILSHGTPWDLDEYVYPDAKTEQLKKYDAVDADFIFQGHTHYPMKLELHGKIVINPGSVGQSRNRNPAAHWAIFDSETLQITFKTTPYSIDYLLKEIDQFDPENRYLKTVLTRI